MPGYILFSKSILNHTVNSFVFEIQPDNFQMGCHVISPMKCNKTAAQLQLNFY